MIAPKEYELLMTDTQVKPEGEAGTPDNSSRPEEVKDESLDQQLLRDNRLSEDFCGPHTANVLGSELDPLRPQMADVQQNLKPEEKSDTLDTRELQEQSNLDQQHTSVEEDPLGAHEPEENMDNYYQIKI